MRSAASGDGFVGVFLSGMCARRVRAPLSATPRVRAGDPTPVSVDEEVCLSRRCALSCLCTSCAIRTWLYLCVSAQTIAAGEQQRGMELRV